MMDIQKLRQEFEELPDIKGILHGSDFGFNESLNQYYHPDHTNHRLNYAFLMGAWMVWQTAKTQALPEGFVSVDNKLLIDGQDVIAFDAIKHCVFKGGEFLQGYIESDTGHEYEEPVEVTHWMAVEAQEQK